MFTMTAAWCRRLQLAAWATERAAELARQRVARAAEVRRPALAGLARQYLKLDAQRRGGDLWPVEAALLEGIGQQLQAEADDAGVPLRLALADMGTCPPIYLLVRPRERLVNSRRSGPGAELSI